MMGWRGCTSPRFSDNMSLVCQWPPQELLLPPQSPLYFCLVHFSKVCAYTHILGNLLFAVSQRALIPLPGQWQHRSQVFTPPSVKYAVFLMLFVMLFCKINLVRLRCTKCTIFQSGHSYYLRFQSKQRSLTHIFLLTSNALQLCVEAITACCTHEACLAHHTLNSWRILEINWLK